MTGLLYIIVHIIKKTKRTRMLKGAGGSAVADVGNDLTEAMHSMQLCVDASTADVKRTVKEQAELVIKAQAEKVDGIDDQIDRIIEHQNVVGKAVNDLSSKITNETTQTAMLRDEMAVDIKTVADQLKASEARAQKSEHTSYKVRGLLGAKERKSRKIDLEEINRLRNEVIRLASSFITIHISVDVLVEWNSQAS